MIYDSSFDYGPNKFNLFTGTDFAPNPLRLV
jgi:hypothetical protein